MSLIVPMILVERVIQVTPQPGTLRYLMEIERHLGKLTWLIVIPLSNWVIILHELGMLNGVSEVPDWLTLMPVVLWSMRRVKVLHIY